MTIADDDQNPRPQKKLSKSLDAIAALRLAMEQRLAAAKSASLPATGEDSRPMTTARIDAEIPPRASEAVRDTHDDPESPATLTQAEPNAPPSVAIPTALAMNGEPDAPPKVLPPSSIDAPLTPLQKIRAAIAQPLEKRPVMSPEPEVVVPAVVPDRPDERLSMPTAEVKAAPQARSPIVEPADEHDDGAPLPPPLPPEPPLSDATGETTAEVDPTRLYDPSEWSRIMFRIAERSQKLIMNYMERNRTLPKPELPFLNSAGLANAFSEFTNRIVNHPERFVEAQLTLWQGYAQIWQSALARLQGKSVENVVKPTAVDRRFQAHEWQSNWLFDYVKQIYLLTARQMQGWVKKETSDLDPRLAKKIDFFTRQMVDAIAPTNFWMTNPEVLRTIFESNGESLIKGLENLLHDLERGNGELRISMTDVNAFKVGETLAITPGSVVFENELIQLIQYAPSTKTVHSVPLLVIPPWINKYYILDLKEKNSYVRYLVAQGYTVFIVSWVNPDARHALVNFDDYMADGSLAAMREVKRATGADDINVVGYCIGGTLLASTLAYLNEAPSTYPGLPNVRSATYLVTLVDFAEPGDLGVFIDEELVTVAEEKMARQGYMDAATMSGVFNLLRANDLIWSYVVNNYLLGKEPVPFDILYWNADSTNLPAVMQSFYLRRMYLANKLIEPMGLSMKGVPINLRSITTPTFMLSTREDHIAPWKSTYAGTQIYSGPIKFTLASSGHIAGVVNHPSSEKYGYWTLDGKSPPTADEWLSQATEHKGSWWPEWLTWLAPYSGEQVDARTIKEAIEPAPGRYVAVRAV